MPQWDACKLRNIVEELPPKDVKMSRCQDVMHAGPRWWSKALEDMVEEGRRCGRRGSKTGSKAVEDLVQDGVSIG